MWRRVAVCPPLAHARHSGFRPLQPASSFVRFARATVAFALRCSYLTTHALELLLASGRLVLAKDAPKTPTNDPGKKTTRNPSRNHVQGPTDFSRTPGPREEYTFVSMFVMYMVFSCKSYGLKIGHELKLMKHNRHWVLKCSFLRSFQSPSVWSGKCLVLLLFHWLLFMLMSEAVEVCFVHRRTWCVQHDS